jgi:hypothetical protein
VPHKSSQRISNKRSTGMLISKWSDEFNFANMGPISRRQRRLEVGCVTDVSDILSSTSRSSGTE